MSVNKGVLNQVSYGQAIESNAPIKKEVNLCVQIRKDLYDITLSEKNQNSVHSKLISVFQKKCEWVISLIYSDHLWKNMQETHQ